MSMSRRKLLKQGGVIAGLTLGSVLSGGARADQLLVTGNAEDEEQRHKSKEEGGRAEFARVFEQSGFAPTDGFLFGYMECAEGGRGTMVGASGPDFEDLKSLARVSSHYWPRNDRHNRLAGYFMPVLKGQAYRVHGDYSSTPVPTMNAFQEWNWDNLFATPEIQPVLLNSVYRAVARTDGLMVVSMLAGADGNRGFATLTAGGMLRGACSMHLWTQNDTHYPSTSFCAPLLAGESFELTMMATSGYPFFRVTWFPFTRPVFRAPQLRSTGTFQEQTKGFAIGVLDGAVNGNRGEISIAASGRKVATSVHNYRATDVWVRYNTVTMPLKTGEIYTFGYTPTDGKPLVSHYWIPVIL